MDTEKLVQVYLRIRQKRSELAKQFKDADDDLKKKQSRLETELLRFLQDNKQESVRTAAGTFYRQEDIKPAGSDWDAFYKWVRENDAFDALERRIKKGFVVDYMEENDGELPPGVSVYREYLVRVRKAS